VLFSGCLIISESGHYRFGAGRPSFEKEMPKPCDDQKWEVSIRRGQKDIILLGNLSKDVSEPARISHPTFLQRGAYYITIKFNQQISFEKKHTDHHQAHDIETGFILKYEGPDTHDCPIVVPLESLIRDSKDGPFQIDEETNLESKTVVTVNVLSQYLQSQYYSTIRDIRRTYQRAFKALLFVSKFCLSATSALSDHDSELNYLLVGFKHIFLSQFMPNNPRNMAKAFLVFHTTFLRTAQATYFRHILLRLISTFYQ
jgi:hypothetical protein